MDIVLGVIGVVDVGVFTVTVIVRIPTLSRTKTTSITTSSTNMRPSTVLHCILRILDNREQAIDNGLVESMQVLVILDYYL